MINRRNTLLLLGVFVVAGGVVLATGAFSTVEADRTVSVETAGDGSALLQLEANTTYNGIADTSNDNSTMAIGLVDINEDSRTSFDKAVRVTNNGNEPIQLYTNDTGDHITFYDYNNSDAPLSDSTNAVVVEPDETLAIGLEVDTVNGTFTEDVGVTFYAETEVSN